MGVLATSPEAFAVPVTRAEVAGDHNAREALLDRVMGPGRTKKASERLREGQFPAVALVSHLGPASGDGSDVVRQGLRAWTGYAFGTSGS